MASNWDENKHSRANDGKFGSGGGSSSGSDGSKPKQASPKQHLAEATKKLEQATERNKKAQGVAEAMSPGVGKELAELRAKRTAEAEALHKDRVDQLKEHAAKQEAARHETAKQRLEIAQSRIEPARQAVEEARDRVNHPKPLIDGSRAANQEAARMAQEKQREADTAHREAKQELKRAERAEQAALDKAGVDRDMADKIDTLNARRGILENHEREYGRAVEQSKSGDPKTAQWGEANAKQYNEYRREERDRVEQLEKETAEARAKLGDDVKTIEKRSDAEVHLDDMDGQRRAAKDAVKSTEKIEKALGQAEAALAAGKLEAVNRALLKVEDHTGELYDHLFPDGNVPERLAIAVDWNSDDYKDQLLDLKKSEKALARAARALAFHQRESERTAPKSP